MKKVYDEVRGFGEIIDETENEVLIRWDTDPWCPQWYPKDDCAKVSIKLDEELWPRWISTADR